VAGLILGRLASLAVTLIAASLAIFLVLEILPGDPAAIMLGESARPDTLAALHRQLGLDRPAAERYLDWVGGAVEGDLGTSITYGVPVGGLIRDRLLITLPLAALSLAIAVGLALPLGIWAAARRGRMTDRIIGLLAQGAIAIPNFWIGLILILIFSTGLRWFAAGGFPGWSGGAGPALAALLLPAIALGLPQAGILTRVTRAAVLEVANAEFVRTARAKGLTRGAALRRHVVPNALLPVVTIIGLQFSFFVAGAVLVENVFTLPGLGRLIIQALAQRDLVVVEDLVLLFATLVIVVNALVDLGYLLLDPRLRGRA
jgi:peptide/nickel transport system permease protein